MNIQNVTKMIELIERKASETVASEDESELREIVTNTDGQYTFERGVKDGSILFAKELMKVFKGE